MTAATRPLPPSPSLRQLKNQAKDLVKDHAQRRSEVPDRIRGGLAEWASLSDEAVFDRNFSLKDGSERSPESADSIPGSRSSAPSPAGPQRPI